MLKYKLLKHILKYKLLKMIFLLLLKFSDDIFLFIKNKRNKTYLGGLSKQKNHV